MNDNCELTLSDDAVNTIRQIRRDKELSTIVYNLNKFTDRQLMLVSEFIWGLKCEFKKTNEQEKAE